MQTPIEMMLLLLYKKTKLITYTTKYKDKIQNTQHWNIIASNKNNLIQKSKITRKIKNTKNGI
jgi:hypothetical protein